MSAQTNEQNSNVAKTKSGDEQINQDNSDNEGSSQTPEEDSQSSGQDEKEKQLKERDAEQEAIVILAREKILPLLKEKNKTIRFDRRQNKKSHTLRRRI